MAQVQVLQVPPGSLIVLKGVDLDSDTLSAMTEALAERFGHSSFCLVHVPDAGEVEVWTEDDDLAERFTALLARPDDEDDDEPDDDGPPAPIVGVPGPPPIQLPQVDDVLDGKHVIRP